MVLDLAMVDGRPMLSRLFPERASGRFLGSGRSDFRMAESTLQRLSGIYEIIMIVRQATKPRELEKPLSVLDCERILSRDMSCRTS